MLTFRRQILLKLFKLLDLLNLSVAFLLGALAVSYEIPNVSFESLLSMRIKIENIIIFFLFLLIWHKIYNYFGLYSSRRLSHKLYEIFDVAKATTLATLIIALGAAIFHIKIITPLFLLVFWLSVTCISISTRLTRQIHL